MPNKGPTRSTRRASVFPGLLPTLSDQVGHEKHGRLMAALDGVNRKFGRNVVRTAAQSVGGVAKITQQGSLSPGYTTDWAQMLRVNIT